MPIVMSEKEWSRINQWTNPPSEDPEVAARREYVNYLNTTSNAMTKSWPNSLENMNKRNEELRQARILAAEQANTKFYKKYLKKQKHEQEQLMYSARDTVFKSMDAPKLLLSAVIETATQHERAEQLKFLNERRREQAEQKKKDDDEIVRKANEWHALMALKRKRRFEANKEHQKDILDQAHEIEERKRTEYEAELNQQKKDNIEADAEVAALKRFEEYYNTWERERIFKDMREAKEAYEERKREQAVRDKMDNDLIKVLNRSRARVEARRKKTEKDIKDEKLRVLEAISKKLQSGDAAREEQEQAILDKAIQQRNAAEDARHQADLHKRQQFKKERQEVREKYLRDEAQRLHEFHTTRQWEVMNRFKNAELYKDFKEKLRKEKEQKIKEFREDTIRLWKEREEREARELAETRYFYGELAEQKIRAGDNRVLTHAAHLLDECRRHGRPEYALQRTVDQYCKMHRLYPMPPLPTSMAEHFKGYKPWDGSKPDVDYKEPPPPEPLEPTKPVAATTSEVVSQGPKAVQDGKRDGLQASPKTGPSKPAASNTNKLQEDYKRVGRADGLQRRNLQTTLSLPEVTVGPCVNPACQCELKP